MAAAISAIAQHGEGPEWLSDPRAAHRGGRLPVRLTRSPSPWLHCYSAPGGWPCRAAFGDPSRSEGDRPALRDGRAAARVHRVRSRSIRPCSPPTGRSCTTTRSPRPSTSRGSATSSRSSTTPRCARASCNTGLLRRLRSRRSRSRSAPSSPCCCSAASADAAIVLALMVLPWALPGVVEGVIWSWIYDPTFGVLNSTLQVAGGSSTVPPVDRHPPGPDASSSSRWCRCGRSRRSRRSSCWPRCRRSPASSTRQRASTARRRRSR